MGKYSFAAIALIAALTIYLMIVGRALILPIVVAVVLWYLIAMLASTYGRIRIAGRRMPEFVSILLAVLSIAALITAVIELGRSNVDDVIAAAPEYQKNLEALVARAYRIVGIEDVPTISQLIQGIDFGNLATSVASSLGSFAGNVGVILIYVIFLLIEQRSFDAKLRALVRDPEREASVRAVIGRITTEIQTYVWITTLTSLMTGVLSYVVLLMAGVDFAEFWAIIIFLLAYIPTIGSILGVVFPALLALVQFDTLVPFVIVVVGIGIIQIVIGNIVQPRMMGKSLNLSPLVILVSLAVWGTIWGVIGMFLSVPITVIGMIILSHFESTRPVAVLLSADGRIDSSGEEAVRAR